VRGLDATEPDGGYKCRYVKGLVEKEIAAGTPANRIVVGGFSQGGAIAIMMLRELKELAGVVGAVATVMEPSIIEWRMHH
jgi:predicted esterase